VKVGGLAALAIVVMLVACGGGSTAPVTAASPFVTVGAAPTIRPGTEGTTCGKLAGYASSSPKDLTLTLEIRLADQSTKMWRYRLTGRGTAPSDLSTKFDAGTPQVLYINGWFAPVNPASPAEVNVTDFSVMRITEPCPMTY
jgi:hypothetical protein